MTSKQAFEAMEKGEWGKVKEIISTTSWAPAELEKKHGVSDDLMERMRDKTFY